MDKEHEFINPKFPAPGHGIAMPLQIANFVNYLIHVPKQAGSAICFDCLRDRS
ncbi:MULTISPECIES: hypothetical protein [Cyanophyceae]|uniref:hypothetical protein n=1 Tax=Cyanophyceae TaxID=3028117 RepID=UPI0016879A8D|nr:hypothetical protein [Trichocoleus sp. FACHB-69]MBD1933370.1 hypothetical protein [Trichocoleus sp. FACHB-69]